jgi:hypothetical protein
LTLAAAVAAEADALRPPVATVEALAVAAPKPIDADAAWLWPTSLTVSLVAVAHRHVVRGLDMADLAADHADLAEDAAYGAASCAGVSPLSAKWPISATTRPIWPMTWPMLTGALEQQKWPKPPVLLPPGPDGAWPPPPTPVDGPARAGDAIASAAIETRVMVFTFWSSFPGACAPFGKTG